MQWAFIFHLDKIFIMQILDSAYKFENLKTFKAIHELLEKNDKLLIFLIKAEHKIKKKQNKWLVKMLLN